MKVLVSGVAGFIGMHVAQALLARGDEVVGVDSLTDQYEVALTYARLARIQSHPRFRFIKLDVADRPAVNACFASEGFSRVVHLATQAGGGRAVQHPRESARPNLVGFINMLEGCRQHGVPHMVYASSSNVYGGQRQLHAPCSAGQSLSASEVESHKKPNELMAQAYSRLHGLTTTGLRFFTVYGPWGRPDMAYYGFTKALLAGDPIPLGRHVAAGAGPGLTYVDDIVDGVLQALRMPLPAVDGPAREGVARILNIGSHDPVRLLDFVAALENAVGRDAELKMLPMAPEELGLAGEGPTTRAPDFVGERRSTMPLAEGVQRFVHWYLSYHGQHNPASTALRRPVLFEAPSAVPVAPAARAHRTGAGMGEYLGSAR